MSTYNEELVLNVNIMLGIANQLTVRVLNAVLREDSTAPIIATPHNLCVDCALLSKLLGRKWSQGVLNISSHWVFRPLDANDVLILAIHALHNQPGVVLVALVLVSLDEVPAAVWRR